MPELKEWESFYVILGSAGAALTGLQFVVIALTVDLERRSSTKEIDAYATPTIVHFCATLVIAAIVSAPWHSIHGPQVMLALAGWSGVGYALLTGLRAHRTSYRPVLEDWIFHVACPFAAYVAVGASAIALSVHETGALFATAGATLLLLVIGIHNTWDTVTFLAFGDPKSPLSERGAGTPATAKQAGTVK